jgi:O-antigen/teichoic acid export membrane protein
MIVEGARRVAAGLVDQAVIAGANAGMTVLAAVLLDRNRSGALLLCIGLAYLVLTLNRAFVGDVLVVLTARLDRDGRARLLRNGLTTAVTFGAVAAAILLLIWAFRPRHGKIDLQDLVWVAPFLPAILLHDTGRSSYLAERRQGGCLVIDLVWVTTQALTIGVLVAAGDGTAGAIFASWGIGATAGSLVFLALSRQWPWRGDPRRWIAETRQLSGWFTATQIIGQIQVQAVSFIVNGRLSQRDLSGLRIGQTALIQPVQNFIMAVQGLVVPRLSRLAGDAGRLPDEEARGAAWTLRRQTRLLALAFAGLAIVMIAVAVPVAHLVLAHVSKFADIAPLALPLSLQAGIYLVELPFAAALRGMHRARLLFVRYCVFTSASLTGLVIGAGTDKLQGAVWGLVSGAVVSLVTMISFYRYAVARLGRAGSDPTAPGERPLPASVAEV